MRFAKETLEKMETYEALGYEVIVGNDWRLGQRPKYRDFDCVKLAQTNHRQHGKSVRTVWAIKLKPEAPEPEPFSVDNFPLGPPSKDG